MKSQAHASRGPLEFVHLDVHAHPQLWKGLFAVLVGVVIALLPVPDGLKPAGWWFFALFCAVVVGLILEPIPAAAVGVAGVALATVLGLVEPKPADAIRWALSGFSNTTVWLIFGAFMFALGYEKSGLGRRLALGLVKKMGGNSLGLGYAVSLSDVVLAPFTPSNTARSGGTIFPVIRNIPELYDSEPGPTSRRLGGPLLWTALATTCVTSTLFLTGLAPNLLALEVVKKTAKIDISWSAWLLGVLPVGLVLLAVVPFLVYKIYPPEVKKSAEVPAWAGKELLGMGRVSRNEVVMAALAVGALAFWIFGGKLVDATAVAFAAIALMVILGVVAWDDILANKAAWNVLVWFATLVALADGLNRVGFVTWFAKRAAAPLAGFAPLTVMVLLTVLFYVTHYMFASITAHVTAMLPVMLAAGAAVPGVDPRLFALMLCYTLGIMGILTPYATGPSPVYFGSGFVPRKDFWRLGAIFGFVYIAVLLVVGVPWLLWMKP
ncbi:MAG TPA: anion permease [Thermoanaerobaculia bacterium]|nr:anion permease [Thermoanaerobaculia bacterium]